MSTETITVRPAVAADLHAMAQLAGALVRFHHDLDASRFFLARGVEAGYEGWFTKELANPDAILLSADHHGTLVGYLYGRFEARDWNLLLDRHAVLHDILLKEESRGHGAGDALVGAFVERCEARGYERIVLHTAVQNERAQRLFARHGFRPTMIEMTRIGAKP